MPKPLHGVLPIAQTLFLDNDDIDLATLLREVDWAFQQCVDGLGTGMVSELLKLTAGERKLLAEKLVEFAAGGGKVIAWIVYGLSSAENGSDSLLTPFCRMVR